MRGPPPQSNEADSQERRDGQGRIGHQPMVLVEEVDLGKSSADEHRSFADGCRSDATTAPLKAEPGRR